MKPTLMVKDRPFVNCAIQHGLSQRAIHWENPIYGKITANHLRTDEQNTSRAPSWAAVRTPTSCYPIWVSVWIMVGMGRGRKDQSECVFISSCRSGCTCFSVKTRTGHGDFFLRKAQKMTWRLSHCHVPRGTWQWDYAEAPIDCLD